MKEEGIFNFCIIMQIHCIGYFNFTKNAKKGSFFYYYLAVRIIFSNFALSNKWFFRSITFSIADILSQNLIPIIDNLTYII